jgi:flagellar hook-associated protein 1 FlgK
VTAVGTLTSEAKINAESTESLKRQMLARRDNESGVSLDEEAANLIKYQMAYQASARVVSSVQQVFDALLQIR